MAREEERVIAAVGSAAGGILIALVAGVVFLVSALWPKPRLRIPLSARFEHTHIVGGSGHGKTQLLQHLIATEELPAVARGERTLIVIDSQGDMLEKILRLSSFSPSTRNLSERLIYLDPTDVLHPPALNLFDFGLARVCQYDAVEREKLINGTVYLYEYLFGALLGAELTARQDVIFHYLARLLMAVPGATIYTLMDFMEKPDLIRPYLPHLDGPTRRFLETQFFSSLYDSTRQQILVRLWAVLSNSALACMFTHRQSKLNLLSAMNRGSVILINTAKDLLKQEGCAIFGRFMIALIAQATQERSAVPEGRRLPTLVYIDEAQDYFDEGMETLISQGRKYHVGLILAHQNLGQFDRRLRASVMASTAIKFVGGVSSDDAAVFAREMRTTPEFIQSLKKTAGETRFALSVRNLTDGVTEYRVPLGTLERCSRMGGEAYALLRADNRERYCGPVDQTILAGSVAAAQTGFNLIDPLAL